MSHDTKSTHADPELATAARDFDAWLAADNPDNRIAEERFTDAQLTEAAAYAAFDEVYFVDTDGHTFTDVPDETPPCSG